MESTVCNLCGASESTTLYRFHLEQENAESGLVRCSRCSLVYLTPRPEKDKIGFYFQPNYQKSMLGALEQAQGSALGRFALGMIRRRRLPPVVKDGRLLDLGCSNGAYLAAAREEGWDVQGIEIDPAAAAYARDVRGLNVIQDDAGVALAKLPDSHFDVVSLWHVLHLFYDPAAVLSQIHRILKPGGTLLLELPNIAAPSAAVFGKRWFPLDVPRHLYQFTPATLEAMLSRVGLRLAKVSGVPSPEALLWSLSDGPASERLSMNPLGMCLAFAVSSLLAPFRLSDHMSAIANR